MKRILSSLFIMAAALLSVPATAQDVTTYDFEDGVALFTADSRIGVSVVDGTQTIYNTAFALDGKAVSFKGASNAQNGYSFAHFDFSSLCERAAKVKVEFDAVLGNGARSIISIGDGAVRGSTGNSSKTTYSNKGAIFRVGSDKSNGYVNGTTVGIGTVTQKWLKVMVEVDEVAKTYSYAILAKETGETLYSGSNTAFYSSDATNCTQIDFFGYINDSQMGLIDNLIITVTKDEREQAEYTVNFLDSSNDPIKEAATRSGAVGDGITLLPSDKDPLWNEDKTQKYIYADDDADGKVIAADGSTSVNVFFRNAEVYNYSLVSSLGATLATGTGFEGESPRVGYPRYQVVDGKLYMSTVDNKEYRKTVNLTEDNTSVTVAYGEVEANPAVVFYTEAEDIEGMTVVTNDNIPVRASNAKAAVSSEDVTITTLPVGKYIFHAGIFTSKSGYSNLTVNFGIGSRTFAAAFTAVNLNETASEEYVVTKDTDIKYLASSSANTQFDYIWIEKTGEPTGDEIAAAEAAEALAAAKAELQAAITAAQAIDTTDKLGVEELQAAIAAAEAALAAEDATVESLAAAKAALEQAVADFEAANTPEPTVTELADIKALKEFTTESEEPVAAVLTLTNAKVQFVATRDVISYDDEQNEVVEQRDYVLIEDASAGYVIEGTSLGKYVVAGNVLNGTLGLSLTQTNIALSAAIEGVEITEGEVSPIVVSIENIQAYMADNDCRLAEFENVTINVADGALSFTAEMAGGNAQAIDDMFGVLPVFETETATGTLTGYMLAQADATVFVPTAFVFTTGPDPMPNEFVNADFSADTPIDNNLCGYGKDMAGKGTTYYGLQDITGWNKVVLNGDDSNASFPNSGMGGAVFAYGSEWQMMGNNKTAPAAGPNGETGNALGFFAVWGCGGYYTQDITLSAGKYALTFPIYNQSGTQANETYTGFFVKDSDVKYTVAINTTVGQWVNQTVEIELTEETAGEIRIGYKSTGSGSGANPMIFVDCVKIQSELDGAIDAYNVAFAAATAAAQDEVVTGSEKDDLISVIRTYTVVDMTDVTAVKAATAALNEAVATFNAAKAYYVAYAALNAQIEEQAELPYADAVKKPAAGEAATSAADAEAKTTALTTALRAYYESNVKAEGIEGAEVMAEAIVNPIAADGTNGWTTTGNGSVGVKDETQEPWTTSEGNSAFNYFDGGNWGANSWDVTTKQDITLNSGKYVLSAMMRASTNVTMTLFAGEETATATVVGSTNGVFGRGWNNTFVPFTVLEDASTVGIGVQGVTSNNHEWMSFSDFRLVRLGDIDVDEALVEAREALQAEITAAEALLADESKTAGREEFAAAIETAKAALNATTVEEVTAATQALKDAVTTFKYANIIVPEGSYYVMNAAYDEPQMFMAGGHNWGTKGIISEQGIDLKFTYDMATNTYTIDTRLSNGDNNHYLSNGLWMDGAPFGWTIEGDFVYTISAVFDGVKKYIAVDSNNELVLTEDGTADNAQWAFMMKDFWENEIKTSGLAALEAATVEAPANATFLIKSANFNRNDQRNAENWTIEADNKNLAGGGDNGNGCAESYHAAFTLSQQLADAPAGIYALTAQGYYRQDDNAVEDVPVFYANEETMVFPVKTGSESSMGDAGASFTEGNYTIEPIYVQVTEAGQLTVGAKGTATHQWVIWDNFQLNYYGANATMDEVKNAAILAELKQLREKATELKEQVEIEVVKAAIDEALAATADVTGAEAINAAIATMKAVVDKAEASVIAKEVLPKMKQFTEATNLYTAEAFDTYYTQWNTKYTEGTLTKDEANALQDPNAITGWRAANTVDDLLMSVWDAAPEDWNTYHVNTWSTEGETDGSDFKVPFIEYWVGDGESLAEKTLTATVTGLEAGDYEVSAWVRVRVKDGNTDSANGITLQVGEGEAISATTGEQVGESQFYLATVTAEGTVAEDGQLTVKFNVAADNNISWLAFKNVVFTKKAVEPQPVEGLIYSWEGAADGATEEGGEIAGGGDEDRINYSQAGFYTICLRGKADYSTQYVTITLDEGSTINAGDEIAITAFRNKNETGKKAGAKMQFDNDASVTTGDGTEFVNLNAAVETSDEYGTEPNTVTVTVPEGVVGSKTIKITRSQTGTNLFITKLQVTKKKTPVGIEEVKDRQTDDAIYTLSGMKMQKATKGLYIINGKKVVVK